MKAFLKNRWTVVGLLLMMAGWGPFCVVLVLRLSGRGPGANLTAFGLLLFATFWPALVCLVLGLLQTLGKRRTRDDGDPDA